MELFLSIQIIFSTKIPAVSNNILLCFLGRATSRLMVSNLDFGVDDRDMKELFSQFGQLIECRVLYERNSRSTGTAEITFDSVANARKAKQEYHRVPLDGREMVSFDQLNFSDFTFSENCLHCRTSTLINIANRPNFKIMCLCVVVCAPLSNRPSNHLPRFYDPNIDDLVLLVKN